MRDRFTESLGIGHVVRVVNSNLGISDTNNIFCNHKKVAHEITAFNNPVLWELVWNVEDETKKI